MASGFDTVTMSIEDMRRFQKRGARMAESAGTASVANPEEPLAGTTRKTKSSRHTRMRDILNISSGTRCTNCGLLYFCWTEKCSACGRAMDFNLGHRDEEAMV